MSKGEFVVPSSESDRKKISDAVKEAGDSMLRKQAESDLIKDIAQKMKEDFDMPPAAFNKFARVYFKSTYAKISRESEEFNDAYVSIMSKVDPSIQP